MRQPYEIALDLAELRVPFLHQGRTIAGIDCTGLLVYIAEALGVPTDDPKVYAREPSGTLLRETLERHLGPPVSRPPGVNDVLLMQLPGQAQIGHVGIVVPHPHGLGIVHAYAEIGRVVYQRMDQRRLDQIEEVYAWPVKV
jgi:hypothetical protein